MSPKMVSPSLTEQLSTADRPLARQERFGQVFEDAGGGLTRRAVLGAGLAAAAATLLPACAPTPTTLLPAGLTPPIRSRATWGADLPPLRPMRIERVGDVRFLLVHHTASSNDYAPGDVGGLLRGFYRYHTSRVKGWPDIAYNFLIDRYGNVWEGAPGVCTLQSAATPPVAAKVSRCCAALSATTPPSRPLGRPERRCCACLPP